MAKVKAPQASKPVVQDEMDDEDELFEEEEQGDDDNFE